ncbi:MAG: hypothetical protein KGJ80_09570, partial [Chloroflexota bacterium]|nr:hypothetical protein [Chloroflexota bacterium]
ADVVAGVHLDRDRLVLDAIAQEQSIKNEIEFGGQGFFGFQARLARRTEIDWAGHCVLVESD